MADVPDWVSKQLLENALQLYFKDTSIHILEFTSTVAVPKGENHASDIFRTSIMYETASATNTLPVIIKCDPHNEKMLKMVKEMKRFEKETDLYMKTLPAINEVLGNLGPLTSNYIYSEANPHNIIIFEDLQASGFKMLDRLQGLDLEHCLFTVEKMAHFHAASLVVFEKDPLLIAKYTEGLYTNTESVLQFIESGFNFLIKACATWPGFEKYSIKLKAIGDTLISKSMTAPKRKLGGFNVLNHGDAWVNNFMYSYTSEEKLQHFRLVDFQLTVHSSPALDLHFFWATSPTTEVKRNHFNMVLDHYYANLLAMLTRLHYSLERVPTRQQLQNEWNSRAFYGLLTSATALPLIIGPRHKNIEVDNILADDSEQGFRYKCYTSEMYRRQMEYLLPLYDELGALDFC